MILRIEDTDQTRFVEGAEQYIVDSLNWVGIKFDEGHGIGGPHAPYRQSERKDIYKKYAQQLIDAGHAYYAFDTEAELEAMRERLKAANVAIQQYNSITRTQMRNSITLPAEETKALIESGAPYVVRLKVPRKEEIRLNDLIRGWVNVHSSQIDDKVLLKSDGMPTYHLANVVDDYLMKISHVIRGEEWLPSAPLHVLLYRFLGWENDMPQFAHLPLLLKPDGNGKLSKRDAVKFGFPIFPQTWKDESGEVSIGYREAGYLPEALINFLALLGWNPGTEKELFTMEELIREFSLERINKAGARFDIQKAQWFNQQYLRVKSDEELADALLASLKTEGVSCSEEKAVKIAAVMRDRITFPKDLWEQGRFFFQAPESYDQTVVAKKWNDDVVKVLTAYKESVASGDTSLSAEQAKELLEQVTASLGIGTGKILQTLRVAITGAAGGPDLMMIMEIIGKEEVASRLGAALTTIKPRMA